MTGLLVFFLAFALYSLASASAQILVTVARRIPLRRIRFGFGPVLLARRVRDVELQIALLPLASYIEFEGEFDADPPQQGTYYAQPGWVRALVSAVGPLVGLLLAACILGPSRALLSCAHGFEQLVGGAVSSARASALVGAWQRMVGTAALSTAIGTGIAKLVAINSLPLPTLSGGRALLELVRKPPEKHPAWRLLHLAGSLVGIWFGIAFLIAVVRGMRA